MRILQTAAGAACRAAELAVAKAIDVAVGLLDETTSPGRTAEPPTPSEGVKEEKSVRDCWTEARTHVENTLRFRAGQDRHFVACATFHHEDGGRLMSDLILLRNFFENKPPREATAELQRDMNMLLWTFVKKYGDKS